ncbi:hypothetical protein DXG01_006624, partial [Tephrocybe rancida]
IPVEVLRQLICSYNKLNELYLDLPATKPQLLMDMLIQESSFLHNLKRLTLKLPSRDINLPNNFIANYILLLKDPASYNVKFAELGVHTTFDQAEFARSTVKIKNSMRFGSEWKEEAHASLRLTSLQLKVAVLDWRADPVDDASY